MTSFAHCTPSNVSVCWHSLYVFVENIYIYIYLYIYIIEALVEVITARLTPNPKSNFSIYSFMLSLTFFLNISSDVRIDFIFTSFPPNRDGPCEGDTCEIWRELNCEFIFTLIC
jgi:hypothetical protein